MKQQKFYNAKDDFALICDIAKKMNLNEKVVELLFSRNLTTEDQIKKFFNPTYEDFNDPFFLSGMKEATERIKTAIQNKERVLVFGDYDVDGVSASAIVIKTLEKLGLKASYYLPNRFVDGYGLTNDVIVKVKNEFNPSLIITVDCGISCANEVEFAKTLGIEIIVTDHHEIPETIPSTIVVNPKLPCQAYPFRELCGTGVALKLAHALLGINQIDEFLPIAAIATIADIVSLTEENRAIVALGLKLFEKHLPVGLKMLLRENKVSIKSPNSTEIAFKIAPKINSSGRMGEAKDSLELYLKTDQVFLKQQLEKINNYNLARQKACSFVYDDCVQKLKSVNLSNERSIILFSKDWDSGILGIVCARLVETYNRPVFLFSEENGVLKGSARSIPDVNVHEILSSLSDILETFGGHKMAAGLCLKIEHFKTFCEKVNSFILNKISPNAFQPVYFYDLNIEESQITDSFLKDLEKLEPFGLNNSKPLLKIVANKAKIAPLPKFPNHYNINIGKLSLLYFNCLEKYFALKYAKDKHIIFELQGKQGNQIKGIVKSFDGGFELDKSFSSNLDSYYFEQLKYLNNKDHCQWTQYDTVKLIEILADCETSTFGTIFVSAKCESYRNFIENYCSCNIGELFVFNNSSDSGCNALYLYPTNLEIFKNYKKIVFLEPVLDKSYLAEIKKHSSAEIYIPQKQNFNKKMFSSLNLSRQDFANFFVKLKEFNNQNFVNISHFFNVISKQIKINFNNFYVYYLILSELNVIKLIKENEQFKLEINNNKKTDLNLSPIYKLLNYLKQINR